MRTAIALACLSLAAATAAAAQPAERPAVVLSADGALLNVTAEGRSERAPDLATFNAGVVTQAKTAAAALAANSTRMDATIAALRRAGVAERDLQTSTLQLAPQYYYPQPPRPVRNPDGSVTEPAPEPQTPRIIGYEARNTLTVKVRRVTDLGRIVDALVAAGANQVDGPYFSLDKPEAATDEARVQALRNARARAELYAREAGFRTVRIVSMTEGGGYYPVVRDVMMVGRAAGAMAPPPPPPPPAPVQPGEVAVGVSLSVQFALER
ncbi:SIMPL domain-containing protein [Phenylobacterium sp.]|uniref:SIMPL domain-containing protein n=1 Tax=Phenylobacterium sp. TaxID=1871053 RepID=UPI002F92F44B